MTAIDRTRNRLATSPHASRPAQLPALGHVVTGNPALDRLLSAMRERLEVREGERGNPHEKVLVHRDLYGNGPLAARHSNGAPAVAASGAVVIRSPDDFAQQILNTNVFRQLTARIDDPSRFHALPAQVRDLLLSDLAKVDGITQANIRRLDEKFSTATDSLAYTIEEITASVVDSAAAVRRVAFASASQNRATAGQVTQITARLDGFDGGVATIEETMTAIADRATGLEAQYVLKVAAGGAIAGIGVAATDPVEGEATSAVIIMADKFALVHPSDTIADVANPPADRIPFGVDLANDVVYINGQVRISSGTGTRLDSVAKRIQLSFPQNVFRVDAAGSPDVSSIAFTATNLNGLTGNVSWSVVTGTATLTGSGTSSPSTRTLFFSNMSTDLVTVRASVTDTGVTYTADLTLVKMYDGDPGADGTDGDRGSLIGYASSYGIRSSAWEDQKASRIIHNIINGASLTTNLASTTHLRHMDTVTLTNASPWLYTKGVYNAGTAYVRGDLVVNTAETSVYRCILTSTGNAVTNTTYFVLYTTCTDRNAWANATSYAMNDVVTGVDLGSTSTSWLCLYAHTSTGTFATERDGGGYLETRYWTGSAWVRPGVIIDGNLAVTQNISGGANIDIYGKAVFSGATATADGETAVTANPGRVADYGIITFAASSGTGAGVLAIAGSASGSYGVKGSATLDGVGLFGLHNAVSNVGVGGGVYGSTNGPDAYGVRAHNEFPGKTALEITGGVIKLPTAEFSTGSVTPTFNNKPGAGTTVRWFPVYYGTTKGWMPWVQDA